MKDWIPVKLHKLGDRRACIISLPENLFAEQKWNEGRITVYAGLTKAKAMLKIDTQHSENSVHLSSALLQQLHIPAGITIGSRICRNGRELHLGPVIAIMADPRRAPKPFGEQNSFINNLVTAANRLNCYAYAFSYTDGIVNGVISGYRKSPEGWHRLRVPLPDVVYDRCLVTTQTQYAALSRIKKQLKALGASYFNRPIGSKLRVYKYLKTFRNLRPYLPETVVANSISIRSMLSKHNTIYVKPSMGTQGNNVIRVDKIRRKGYTATFVRRGKRITMAARSATGLVQDMRFKRGRIYLAQQGIDLVKFGSRIADIRVLTQRDINGKWLVTGAAARIGQAGSPVSNIHQGGGALSLPAFFEKAFPSTDISKESLLDETYTLAINISEALDAGIGDIAELGIDIGIDKNARLWLIEVNPRPGRTVFKLIGNKVLQLRSIIRPVEYACFIASERYRRKEQQDVQKAHGTNRA